MQRVRNPLPIWLDQRGALVDAGFIYIGEAGDDPESAPVDVFWDAAATIPADQPLRTRGGVIVNNGSPAALFVAADDYSMRVRDADGSQIFFSPSTNDTIVDDGGGGEVGPVYQPLDDDLTAIAALVTTTFGRSLLTMTDAAAVKAALSIVAGLATTGGTVSGNIVRSGAGSHLYHNDAALISGRVFVTAVGATDPTSLAGDVWLAY